LISEPRLIYKNYQVTVRVHTVPVGLVHFLHLCYVWNSEIPDCAFFCFMWSTIVRISYKWSPALCIDHMRNFALHISPLTREVLHCVSVICEVLHCISVIWEVSRCLSVTRGVPVFPYCISVACVVKLYTYSGRHGISALSRKNALFGIDIVPDRRCRILKVILVRRGVTWVLGIWRGGGIGGKDWERGGQFTSNLGPRWTDPVTARRVPSK
jgi:hypothetical protein